MIEPEIDRILVSLHKQIASNTESEIDVAIPYQDAMRLMVWAGVMREAEMINSRP